MNKTKTEAMWLGINKNSRETHCNLTFKKQLKILGIVFKNDTPASQIMENWQQRINKIKKIMTQWSKRNLSISGKLCIIKSFLIAQFVYPMQALLAPSQILTTVNTLLFRFLWKKKFSNTKAFEKVKRSVVCSDITEGGIKMININDMQTAFLLNWVNQLQITLNKRWRCIPVKQINMMGSNMTVLNATVNAKQLKGTHRITSLFWRQAVEAWVENRGLFEKQGIPFPDQPLWNNQNLQYKNRHLFIKKWIDAGLSTITNVWNNNVFLSLEDIRLKTGPYPSIQFDYNAVQSAVRAYDRKRNAIPLIYNEANQTTGTSKENMTAKAFRTLITNNKTLFKYKSEL